MAAQVEVQAGEVGRTGVGGRLHLSPLTDSSNKALIEIPPINQSHIITTEPNKPVPGPKPRLSPKPFSVERNPTIKPILAPKPQPKPRPEVIRPPGPKPELPSSPKPPHTPPTGKPRPGSTNPNRPTSTTIKTSNRLSAGQTTKPVVHPFKPAPPLIPGDPGKPVSPVPPVRQRPSPSSIAYAKTFKKLPAEWSGSTKNEDEKDQKGGSSISRAKSMGSLDLCGQEEEENTKAKPEAAVSLRPQPRGSRTRPVSAIFLDSSNKTEASTSAPRWTGRRPLSADLTSKFESIGLSLHRKTPKADAKENTPEEKVLPQVTEKTPNSATPQRTDVESATVGSDQSIKTTEELTSKEPDEQRRAASIKKRISLLLDSSSSSSPGAGSTGQDVPTAVQPVPETEPAVGVKQLIKQLTEDPTPTQSPVLKPSLKPRPLPLDLTKRFSSERSPDPGSEATEHHDISKDPQMRAEESTITPSERRTFEDFKDSLSQTSMDERPEAEQMLSSASKDSAPTTDVQKVRASLFENVVERHNVMMVDEAKAKDSHGSPSLRRGSSDEGTLVTAVYKEPVSPSSPQRVLHSFDTVQAVDESRAVSESVPSAHREDKAMTLRSRRSEGSRPTEERNSEPALPGMPEQQPRYLRIGALPKWSITGLEQDTSKGPQQETLETGRERQRETEQGEVAAAPKRLKMLSAEEQPKPRATYFALTGQIQEPGSPSLDTNSPFDDLSMRSQGKLHPAGRNPSLEEAFSKGSRDQFEESTERKIVDEMMDVEKKRELIKEAERKKEKLKELEREKQRQLELEKEAHLEFERMKERERQREHERQRQKAYEMEKQEFEEKQRALDRQKQIELENQRLQELVREKQERERQQHRFEKEKRREMERKRKMELEKLREEEKERQREQERLRQREEERQRELDRERQLENQRLQELEREKQERERQQRLREKEIRREMERKRKMELEKLREEEKERQREQERLRQREEERQRELDRERQLLELQKEKQRMEELERAKEIERQQLLEFQKQKQKEKERMQILEMEKQRLREKMEREEAEKIKQMALEQEMLRLRELDKERERQKEMERELEREKQRELERQRQIEMDRERQRQLDKERQELENQRQRRELEKERQKKKEEMERVKEMERRQLLEFEKQKQAERERQQIMELEKRRVREKMEKEEADKMRLIAKQQEAERQRLKENQKKLEQERARLEASALRPKVVDLDSVLRNDPFLKTSPQHSDPATRWKEPSQRAEESYRPAILDIDSFTSQAQHYPTKELFPVSGIQGADAAFGARLQPNTERDISWKMPAQATTDLTSPAWTTSPQDPWELRPVEMSVDKPVSEPRKPTSKMSPNQLLLRLTEDRTQSPQIKKDWSTAQDEPLLVTPLAGKEAETLGGGSGSYTAEQLWLQREPHPPESRPEARSHRRSHGAQELNRMRSRSVSRRSAPSSSAVEGSLSRMRSRSAHREQDRHSWEQQKQAVSGEEGAKDSETPVHETDSQYGTWETGLRTDDSLTPATPSSDSNLSPSPRKPTPPDTPGEPSSLFDADTVDSLPPSSSSENEPFSFPDVPVTLLDTSALRSRAQLGKKRAPRSRPSRAAIQSSEQTEDWTYRDSTEPKAEVKDEESDSEEPTRGVDSVPAVASQPQRVALFPGMDPLALKAQLKKRGDSDNQTEGSAPSPQLSRSPKSPFLPRAARVLPPPGNKENGEEDSPQWLKELKSKKRLSQYENES